MSDPQPLDWAILCPGRNDDGNAAIDRIRAALFAHQPMTAFVEDDDIEIVIRNDQRDAGALQSIVHSADGCVTVIGRLFSKQSYRHPTWATQAVERMIGGPVDVVGPLLSDQIWGGYVALVREPDTGALFLFRDPGGAVPVHVIASDGVIIVVPTIPAWLRAEIDPPIAIDWGNLGHALGDPRLIAYRSLLKNVTIVPPGAALRLDHSVSDMRQLWLPADILALPPALLGREPERILRSTVDGCIRAWVDDHASITLELSGGLDSSIVLPSLRAAGKQDQVACLNLFTDYPGGDERVHARAVAGHFGARLSEQPASERDMNYASLLSGEQPPIPYLGVLDPILEEATSDLACSTGGSAILTGQGGDAVFFEMPTALAAVDFLIDNGFRNGWWRYATEAAMRERVSIWQVARSWLFHRLGRPSRPGPLYARHLHGPALAGLRMSDVPRHPWLDGLDRCPPAKHMQIDAIINNGLSHGPALRRRVASLIHPLLSQPVIEMALGLPCWQQAFGLQDRALARAAFADVLPPAILQRGYKGEATSYYNRCVVENLPWFRSMLLDGELVAHGLLDRPALDQALTEESLLWSSDYQPLIVYASFEAWARWWGSGAQDWQTAGGVSALQNISARGV